jgi:hypothetical protein
MNHIKERGTKSKRHHAALGFQGRPADFDKAKPRLDICERWPGRRPAASLPKGPRVSI